MADLTEIDRRMAYANGDLESRAEAAGALLSADGAEVREAVVSMLADGDERRKLADAMAWAIGGSIAHLGYPVGLGAAPTDEHCQMAASKIIDRLAFWIACHIEDARAEAQTGEANHG